MGDIGEYWREAKEHRQTAKHAASLGMSIKHYLAWEKAESRKEAVEKVKAKDAACTIQCECGRKFLDVASHNGHKQAKGKKGHKGTPITNKETN